MSAPSRQPDASRFIAYSTLTRMPVLSGTDAAELLAQTRAIPALGFDNRFVEILDCGAEGPDAGEVAEPLDTARSLYRTVFRGSGALSRPGMPSFPLQHPSPLRDPEAARAIEETLAGLAGRARAAGFGGLATVLHRAHEAARAEIAAEFGDR